MVSSIEYTLIEDGNAPLSTSSNFGLSYRNRFPKLLAAQILGNHFLLEALKRPTPHVTKTLQRETLRALRFEFGNVWHRSGDGNLNKVPCLHANPERTISKLRQESNIILPITSVSLFETEDDKKRRRNKRILVANKLWDVKRKRAVRTLSFAPRPVNLIYKVNIWTKHIRDMDVIMEQLYLMFNPSLDIETPFSTNTKSFIKSIGDNSTHKVGDREDRIIRKEIEFIVESYIPTPKFLYTNTERITSFNTDVKIVSSTGREEEEAVASSTGFFLLDWSDSLNSMYIPIVH